MNTNLVDEHNTWVIYFYFVQFILFTHWDHNFAIPCPIVKNSQPVSIFKKAFVINYYWKPKTDSTGCLVRAKGNSTAKSVLCWINMSRNIKEKSLTKEWINTKHNAYTKKIIFSFVISTHRLILLILSSARLKINIRHKGLRKAFSKNIF